jgi:hypothetical protein
MSDVIEKIQTILKERKTLEGAKVRWTSPTTRLQLTGIVIGAFINREKTVFLKIKPDNKNFNNFKVPINLIRNIKS